MGKAVPAWNQARAASAQFWLAGWDRMTGTARLDAPFSAAGKTRPDCAGRRLPGKRLSRALGPTRRVGLLESGPGSNWAGPGRFPLAA